MEFNLIEKQIQKMRKVVDYDTKEYPIEVILNKYLYGLENDENDIFIPDYQRAFVWGEDIQSKFIESIFLGLPIPYLFAADSDGRLEIVDGSQRLRTLVAYHENKLRLKNLELLDKLNGTKFKDLTPIWKKRFLNSTLKLIVLTEKSDDDIRFLLFERINTSSELLKDMEKRKGIYRGEFTDFLYELSQNQKFRELTSFSKYMEERGEPQELILRFFAYTDRYKEFKKSVNDFLNEYVKEKNKSFNKDVYIDKFDKMLSFVSDYFPEAFKKKSTDTRTPRVRFEAISVGVYLALEERPNIKPKNVEWLASKEFEEKITGSSTNSPNKVRERIEFVRDKIIGGE